MPGSITLMLPVSSQLMITKCHGADYRNGDSVGKGLRESGLDRDDVFVTTNYACGDLRRPLFGPFSSEFSSRYQR